jgi:hypothetical protein
VADLEQQKRRSYHNFTQGKQPEYGQKFLLTLTVINVTTLCIIYNILSQAKHFIITAQVQRN